MEEKPLLLRAALGEKVERTPVWMMRQAGRHMQCYRDLVAKYPTFRERSEIPEVSTEISLQPYRQYGASRPSPPAAPSPYCACHCSIDC
jgi:uroporphyrinogen decarboxylase